MNEDRRDDHDNLEHNVGRLLSGVQPELSMPARDKERVLRALARETGSEPSGAGGFLRAVRNAIPTGPARWITTAAAAVLLVVILFWIGGMQTGLAWADVARHLGDANSMAAWVISESEGLAGSPARIVARLYQKDPGLSRSEVYGSSPPPDADRPPRPEEAQSIVITSSGTTESTLVRLSPRERTARITRLSFTGGELESRIGMPRDLVAESWRRLQRLASDRTREIGRRTIDGVGVVGFEADIRDLFPDPTGPAPDGVIRLWADRETGTAVEIELDFLDPRGVRRRTTINRIEWNPPLSDALFEPPDLTGWRIEEEEVHQIGFTRTSLRRGVTLRIGPDAGPPVITERDVERVSSGKEILRTGQAEPRRIVFLTLTPAAGARLAEYTSGHLGESVTLDINGEARTTIRIGNVIEREVQVDISVLGEGLERFEDEYLAD